MAFTAAASPWTLVTAYFVFAMQSPEYWTSFDGLKETLWDERRARADLETLNDRCDHVAA